MKKAILTGLLFAAIATANAQDCTSKVTIILHNINGGIYAGQSVTLTNKSGGAKFTANSNADGEAILMVPCRSVFDVTVSNYTRHEEAKSSGEGGYSTKNLSYEPNMAEKDKQFAMTPEEQREVDQLAAELPDTIFVRAGMPKPLNTAAFTEFTIEMKGLDNKPLIGETIFLSGRKNHKTYKGKTDSQGKIKLYLVKGDVYDIGFQYDPKYMEHANEYSKGTRTAGINFSYMGTKEALRRKLEEEARVRAEEERLRKEEEAFQAYCKKLKITAEEGRKAEIKNKMSALGDPDQLEVLKVLNRNPWQEKLIVCDLTGSMSPYTAQLMVWYELKYKLEKNLQFVFFNDGDNKQDSQKLIGKTGGIYYTPSKGIDLLYAKMSFVAAAGGGGDCAENNLEALLTGIHLATPFKELVMIADNNAPVKDISLLPQLKRPVHIIVCGMQGEVHPDYLNIARKSGGSIHTIEQDLTDLASLSEGQELRIGNYLYRIMGGKFVKVSKS